MISCGAFGIAAAFALFFTAMALARAETADGLRTILALTPPAPLAPRKGAITYTDLGVAAAVTGKRGFEAAVGLARRLALVTHGDVLGRAEAWDRKAGFALEDVEALASAGDPPNTVYFFRLAPKVRIETLRSVWAERGFREVPSAAGTLWGRGEAGKLDISKRDIEDPFGGLLGRSSFLLPALPVVAESFFPESLVAVAQARTAGGLAKRADVAALLMAVDLNGGQLLQAALIPEPAAVMNAADGIAPYSALLFADIEHGARAETIVLLAFAACGAARAAEAEMPARWAAQVEPLRALAPSWSVVEGSACVLAGRIVAEGPAAARALGNPSYRTVTSALYRRDLSAIAIRQAR